MFKQKALESVSCVNNADGDVVLNIHRKVVKKARHEDNLKVDERASVTGGDTGSGSVEPERKKSSNLHRNWSKLKKYCGGQSRSDKEIAKFSEVNSQGRDGFDKDVERKIFTSDFEKNDQGEVIKGSSKLLKQNSKENVERWLMAHHQNSRSIKTHKPRKNSHHHKNRSENEKSGFLCYRHSRDASAEKPSTHNSPRHTASSSFFPHVDMDQFQLLHKSIKSDVYIERSRDKLDPALARFIKAICDWKRIQKHEVSETTESGITSHFASTIKNTTNTKRHFTNSSLNPNNFAEDIDFEARDDKFLTSTPRKNVNSFDTSTNSKTYSSTNVESDSFNIGNGVKATLDGETVKFQTDKKELSYDFLGDASGLIAGIRNFHKAAMTEEESLISIYEFIVGVQSKVIEELQNELKSRHKKEGSC